ncbi:hypothetical protein GGTG_06616 [Gaeumannomyces tritici R3-111a-1]|uniref:Uncharacterized protein n=1 Tax=Gaeumannomyces tritici (strain R3-111a-1) TaxID=644352 RepID=J3NZB7_GAET3|nr:hypothetical protein GGTG_06616 [Gaeumannomyces tritici R3-111a-1]EJT76700.1 hypothetical protein GGTG_06616 [Gaeumannomyces tritici R3-111a-1]
MISSSFLSTLLASALVGTSSATAIPSAPRWDQQGPPAPAAATWAKRDEAGTPVFQASNYIWGCSPGGCSNAFNLTAPAGYREGAPGFNVVCNGVYIQSGWRVCWNPDLSPLPGNNIVETLWTDGPNRTHMYLGAAHIYTQEDGTRVNATGLADIVPEKGMSFEFPVTIISTP